MQNNGKERQKACCRCKFVFLLIRCIDLDAIFIALPISFSITRFDIFCLQALLTRTSLLALAKSIYYPNTWITRFFKLKCIDVYTLLSKHPPKNPKMCDRILETLLKMRLHYSQSSRENATPPSGTSPLASYKEVPPPPPPRAKYTTDW